LKFNEKLKEAASKDQNLDWANLSYYWEKNEQLAKTSIAEDLTIFMGDSITEEWGREYSDFFQSPSHINRGIGGQTTPQMLIRFKQDVVLLNPKTVVLLAGTNDIAGNTGPSSTAMICNNIFSMADIAHGNGIRIIICSILPVFEYPWAEQIKNVPDTIEEINNKLKSFTKKNGIVYLDYYSQMVDSNRGLMGKYTTDGVHLNLKGYKVMSRVVKEVLL
tara:strand:- start:205 stop:861 length:657 start_codon:yes stop_codon:yes gene_type:complete